MNSSSLEQFVNILSTIGQFFSNPIFLMLFVPYQILVFMMPFFIIRLSLKCDKLEHKMLMEHADTHDKLNFIIKSLNKENDKE